MKYILIFTINLGRLHFLSILARRFVLRASRPYFIHFLAILARRFVLRASRPYFIHFLAILARRFVLRASTTLFHSFSCHTCAQIHFARKYDPIPFTFLPYLRADSFCAQVFNNISVFL